MDIEEFDSWPRCMKCHASEPYKAYKPSYDGYDNVRGQYTIPEHLELTCRECGYVWKMQCFSTCK